MKQAKKDTREISREVSRRILKILDRMVMDRDTTAADFCQVAGIAQPNLTAIRKGERYFTIDNIYAIGRAWNLDMNLVIYGRRLNHGMTALEQLKEAVERVENEVKMPVSDKVSRTSKKK